MEAPGESQRRKEDPLSHRPGIDYSAQGKKDRRDQDGIERENVGRERDQVIRLGREDKPAPAGDLRPLQNPAPAKDREESRGSTRARRHRATTTPDHATRQTRSPKGQGRRETTNTAASARIHPGRWRSATVWPNVQTVIQSNGTSRAPKSDAQPSRRHSGDRSGTRLRAPKLRLATCTSWSPCRS